MSLTADELLRILPALRDAPGGILSVKDAAALYGSPDIHTDGVSMFDAIGRLDSLIKLRDQCYREENTKTDSLTITPKGLSVLKDCEP